MATTAAPRTPPQTPQHPKFKVSPRRNFTTTTTTASSSPASQHSPSVIHPIETISPPKPPRRRRSRSSAASDGVHVEELAEGDAGYVGDIDVVHPAEFEDVDTASEHDSVADSSEREPYFRAASAPTVDAATGIEELETNDNDDNDDNDNNTADDEEDPASGSDAGISRRFSRLGYNNPKRDQEEARFHEKRHQVHLRKRTESRVFKRSHSQSAKSDKMAATAGAAATEGARMVVDQVADEANFKATSTADQDDGEDCGRRTKRRIWEPGWTESSGIHADGSSGAIPTAAGRQSSGNEGMSQFSKTMTLSPALRRQHRASSVERRDRRLTPDGSESGASDDDDDDDNDDHETQDYDHDADADVAMDLS